MMWSLVSRNRIVAPRPVLDLSGPRLHRAFEDLVESAEATGGVESYISALALKSSLFLQVLGEGRAREMRESDFRDVASFIAPVRRRIGAWLADNKFEWMRKRIAELLEAGAENATIDARLSAFIAAFPADREHRWVRDLGAEILHFVFPEELPLMTRWIWDHQVGTGVLREIWHADDVDSATIVVGDGIDTHLTLRDELQAYLREKGVFRDLPFYVDLLCAHIYSGYINDRGGQYLRADICGETADTMLHTRRMLGLDAIASQQGRTRLKLMDGEAHVLAERRLPHS